MKQLQSPAALAIIFVILGYVLGALFGLDNVQERAFLLAILAFGIVLGMLFDWLLEETVDRNRALARQLERLQAEEQPSGILQLEQALPQTSASPALINSPAPTSNSPDHEIATRILADLLHQRDDELKALREEINETNQQIQAVHDRAHQDLQTIRAEFDAYVKTHPDNLTVIKGIGPVYQRKLRDLGINSFKQLAEANPDKLRRQLDIKDWQKVDLNDWIIQSRDWL